MFDELHSQLLNNWKKIKESEVNEMKYYNIYIYIQKYWSFFFLSQITMVFTVSIQCYLGKKYKKRWTLYTSQCGFYCYQTFDSFFDPYIKSLTYKA